MKAKTLFIAVICFTYLITELTSAQAAGTVIGWGQNIYGQSTNAGTLLNIQAIAAGSDVTPSPNSIGFSLGLQLNGTISGWGNNVYGQTTIPAGASSNIVAIAAGEFHAVALRSDGKVFAWGRSIFFQTNVPSTLSSNVIAIAAGSSGIDNGGSQGTHSLALKNDGTVVAWGLYTSGQTNVPVGLVNVVAIAAGSIHSMALKSDGTVVVWGNNSSLTNVPSSVTNVVAIAAGNSVCMALKTNGTVVVWGNNSFIPTTVPVSASNVVAIAAGDEHCMALRRDGTVVIWGNTSAYSFGVPAGLTNVTAITSAARHALAIVGDGTPGITVPPRSQSVYPGNNATFIVFSAGAGNLTYQWQFNGININGATNQILVVTNAQPTNSGWYQVVVRNTIGTATASAGLTLFDGRVNITQQLATTNIVDANSNLTLSVTSVGATPIYFQWWKDGSIITGATNSSYTITNAQTANAGGYFVVVSNAYNSVSSSTDNVGVIYHPPTFLLQPIGTNVPVGGALTLKASANGTTPLSWQWRTNGIAISGANFANYTNNSAQLTDAGSYDVVVSNSAGNSNSSPVFVNVGYPPAVMIQPPVALTNNAGDTTSFSCVLTGTAQISLQWTLNGFPISGATNNNIIVSNIQSANIGYYALSATNLFGGTVSSNTALNLSGYAFSQWAGLEAYYALNGDATDSSGNSNNGTNIGAVAISDRFGNAAGAMSFDGNSHYIQCKTGAYFGSNFTITAWVEPISYNNYSRILDFGNGGPNQNTDMALTSGTSGQPYLEAYIAGTQVGAVSSPNAVPLNRWTQVSGVCNGTQMLIYFNGILQSTANVNVNRQPSSTFFNYLGRSNWAPDQYFHGNFDDVRIFDRALSQNEIGQLYAIEADIPVITQQPQAQTADAGSTVSFSVTATANNPLTYQWRTNSVAIAGATNAILTITNIQSANIGFYSVAISNSVAGVVSTSALLNLTGSPDPTLNGLLVYYKLDGDATDSSGNGNDGTNFNVMATSDRFGNPTGAMYFGGSGSNYIQCKTGAYFGSNFTISAWVNEVRYTSWARIIDFGNGPGTNNTWFAISDGVSGIPDIGGFIAETRTPDYLASAVFPTNTWVHILGTWDGSHLFYYTNGVLDGGYNAPLNRSTLVTSFNYIGKSPFEGGTYSDQDYIGSFDDIRIYNRAMSSDEAAYLYALESQPSSQSPQALTATLGDGPSFHLNLTSVPPGNSYVVQSTTNLVSPIQWIPILTNIVGTNGVWQFTDTNLGGLQKFYRVTSP